MPITWTWLLERSLSARQPLVTIQANSQIQQMGSLGFLPPVVPHLEAGRKKKLAGVFSNVFNIQTTSEEQGLLVDSFACLPW